MRIKQIIPRCHQWTPAPNPAVSWLLKAFVNFINLSTARASKRNIQNRKYTDCRVWDPSTCRQERWRSNWPRWIAGCCVVNSSVGSSTGPSCTELQVYPLAFVRQWKRRAACHGGWGMRSTSTTMEQIYSFVIDIKVEHSLHNATMEEGSLLHKPTNYYYGPNPLSGFNVLLKFWKLCSLLPYQRHGPFGRNVCWTLSDCACASFHIPTIALYWPSWSDCNFPLVITSRNMLLTGFCEWANILFITGHLEVHTAKWWVMG